MRPKKGQSMVEFAIVLPLFFFIFFAMAIFCIFMNEYFMFKNTAYNAARQASLSTASKYLDISNYYSKELENKTAYSLYYSEVVKITPNLSTENGITIQTVTASITPMLNQSSNLYDFSKSILPKDFTVSCQMPLFNNSSNKKPPNQKND